jgi:VWFA-related protein
LAILGAQAARETAAQQAIPDAPKPQAIPDAPKPQATLPGPGVVTPGKGTSSGSNDSSAGSPAAAAPSAPAAAAVPAQSESEPTPNVDAAPGQGVEKITTFITHVDDVDVPFTVKDSKGKLVAGLQSRDVQVYENNVRQQILEFTTDSFPLSVALVVDQTMTQDELNRVNDSLGALQGAFTQYDEVGVFTYNNGVKVVTDFTGAQSARLTQAIEKSKGTGREPPMAGSYGPLGQTTVLNDQNVDPNTAANRGHSAMQYDAEREAHPLNDAILAAATALSRRPIERRRVIYVISDGKEFGSKAKTAEVIKILLVNRIEVDGTLVGDSAVPFLGVLDRLHLPLMMQDNVLPKYANATGGNFDSELRTGEIEKSFARIADEVRSRYTLGYHTHEPFIDGKYRKIEVVVVGHGNDLTVLAKPGYWPSAMEMRPRPTTPSQ